MLFVDVLGRGEKKMGSCSVDVMWRKEKMGSCFANVLGRKEKIGSCLLMYLGVKRKWDCVCWWIGKEWKRKWDPVCWWIVKKKENGIVSADVMGRREKKM